MSYEEKGKITYNWDTTFPFISYYIVPFMRYTIVFTPFVWERSQEKIKFRQYYIVTKYIFVYLYLFSLNLKANICINMYFTSL